MYEIAGLDSLSHYKVEETLNSNIIIAKNKNKKSISYIVLDALNRSNKTQLIIASPIGTALIPTLDHVYLQKFCIFPFFIYCVSTVKIDEVGFTAKEATIS